MADHYIIAAGGTGALCASSFLYMAAAGCADSKSTYHILLLDKDKQSDAMTACHNLLEDYNAMNIQLGKKPGTLVFPKIVLHDWNFTDEIVDEYCRQTQKPAANLASLTLNKLLNIPNWLSTLVVAAYIFLDAQLDTRTRADDLVIRVNFNNPMRFLMKALEVSISLNGKIKWVGDESMMFALMKEGKTLEDARNYAVEGCFQPTIPGKSIDVPGGPMNTPLFLELALNRGVSRVTGKQIGPDTGDPREFRTYGELWNAFRTQVEALAVHSNIIKTTDWRLRQESNLATCASPFYEGCMETGLDYIEGGTAPYCTHTTLIGGAPNTGNGLAALKKCVYEEQTLTMEEVLEALAHDFEGYQDVQKTLLDAPKFGNDIPYVDRIVNDVISVCSDNITKYHNCNGMKVTASLATVTNNVPLGAVVGATPDGRRAHMPIAEGGISPYQGTNISGLTPTLNSVSRLDFGKFTSGAVLNVKLSPALVNKEENRKQMAEIIRTYFQSGGMLVQFNVVDTETLREAQKHPEEYKDLLVRVSTYSAYFTELSPVLQNDIIARSEIEAM